MRDWTLLLFILGLLLISSLNGSEDEGQCFAKEECSEAGVGVAEKEKYTEKDVRVEEAEKKSGQKEGKKKWKKYLKLIEKAMAEYEECPFTNCSCYER